MRLKILFALFAALLLFSIVAVAHAQQAVPTNLIVPGFFSFPTNATQLPSSTSDDIAKVLHDFGVEVTPSEILKGLLALFFVARIARKYWLKDGSKLANIASHLSLEAPVSTPPPNPPK